MGFDYRTSLALGRQTLGAQTKLVCNRPRRKGQRPHRDRADLPVRVQESPAEAWVESVFCGVGALSDTAAEVLLWEAGIAASPTVLWPQAKLLGGNTAPPINRKLD